MDRTLVPLAKFVRGLQGLAETMSLDELSQRTGKTRGWLQEKLLLGKLSDDTLTLYDDVKISMPELVAMAKKL